MGKNTPKVVGGIISALVVFMSIIAIGFCVIGMAFGWIQWVDVKNPVLIGLALIFSLIFVWMKELKKILLEEKTTVTPPADEPKRKGFFDRLLKKWREKHPISNSTITRVQPPAKKPVESPINEVEEDFSSASDFFKALTGATNSSSLPANQDYSFLPPEEPESEQPTIAEPHSDILTKEEIDALLSCIGHSSETFKETGKNLKPQKENLMNTITPEGPTPPKGESAEAWMGRMVDVAYLETKASLDCQKLSEKKIRENTERKLRSSATTTAEMIRQTLGDPEEAQELLNKHRSVLLDAEEIRIKKRAFGEKIIQDTHDLHVKALDMAADLCLIGKNPRKAITQAAKTIEAQIEEITSSQTCR